MWRIVSIVVAIVVIALGALWLLFHDRVERLQMAMSLFTGAEQYETFNRVYDIFPSSRLDPASAPFAFGEGAGITLPGHFIWQGEAVETASFLEDTDTAALLVIQNGEVRYENYWLTGGRGVQWMSMSVAKSFLSALIGIAIDQGHIRSIEDPVTDYVPELAGSAYDGVRIKDILQMSSGAAWDENYNDPDSDINRFARIFAIGGSMDDFAATLAREFEPGTYNRYNSTDTQVLGMLLVRATGQSVTAYMQSRLWTPMGAESPAYWLLDGEGMEMVFGGLNATARDYAKLGEMYRRGGRLNGRQIVPEDWVHASVTPDAPHLIPGEDNPASDFPLGYGLQWWVPEGDAGEFSAIGVYNQFIYVNPARGLVIVKLSANSDYGTTLDESSYRERETIEFFRAIGAVLAE